MRLKSCLTRSRRSWCKSTIAARPSTGWNMLFPLRALRCLLDLVGWPARSLLSPARGLTKCCRWGLCGALCRGPRRCMWCPRQMGVGAHAASIPHGHHRRLMCHRPPTSLDLPFWRPYGHHVGPGSAVGLGAVDVAQLSAQHHLPEDYRLSSPGKWDGRTSAPCPQGKVDGPFQDTTELVYGVTLQLPGEFL